jgi:hypothetical protein
VNDKGLYWMTNIGGKKWQYLVTEGLESRGFMSRGRRNWRRLEDDGLDASKKGCRSRIRQPTLLPSMVSSQGDRDSTIEAK